MRRTHRQVSASHPLHRKVEARFGIARSRADRKRRAPRDSNHDMRHYTTPTPRQSMHRPQMRHVHRSSRHGCNARSATLRLADAAPIESPASQSATAGRSEARADAKGAGAACRQRAVPHRRAAACGPRRCARSILDCGKDVIVSGVLVTAGCAAEGRRYVTRSICEWACRAVGMQRRTELHRPQMQPTHPLTVVSRDA